MNAQGGGIWNTFKSNKSGKNVFSAHMAKTDILIMVNSDSIAIECPENTVARTPYACIQCHNM